MMRLEPHHDAALRQGKAELLCELRGHPDCTVLGYGFRRRAGRIIDEPVIVASVAKKRPLGYVSLNRLLPRSVVVDGRKYGVDVIQAGRFWLDDIAQDPPPGTRRAESKPRLLARPEFPPQQGVAIANASRDINGLRTYGCLVRDLTDESICFLTSGTGIGSLRGARPGDTIVWYYDGHEDPAPIGRLKRFTALSKTSVNRVDAALIEIDENVGFSHWGQRMAPLSKSHQIIGLTMAHGTDTSSLVQPIGPVLRELNAQLLNCPNEEAIGGADFDLNVEKVGWASGYTSRPIVALGASPVNFAPRGQPADIYQFEDLIQVDILFEENLAGSEYGAAVYVGGDGRTPALALAERCGTLGPIGDMYGLDLVKDNDLADRARDKFLALTKVGRLLIRVCYANEHTVLNRTKNVGPDDVSNEERAGASSLYDYYYDFVKETLADPVHSTATVTDGHIDDAAFALQGVSLRMSHPLERGGITTLEYDLAERLYNEVFVQTKGMGYAQIIEYMNRDSVYRQVFNMMRAVPTIDMIAPGMTE